ncbi:hypothetical protein AAC387_Pa04g1913 [Persea americana]
MSLPEQEQLLEKSQLFHIKGTDSTGRCIIRIVGKFFPARALNVKVWKKYMEEKVFPALGQQPFCLVYLHTHVQSSKNSPGISILRSINEALPITIKRNLEAIYFVHPDLQTKLFMATFGRFLLSRGWYEKLRFINRLEFLWEHVRRGEVEIPEFVYHHDEDLVRLSLIDQGLQRDRH